MANNKKFNTDVEAIMERARQANILMTDKVRECQKLYAQVRELEQSDLRLSELSATHQLQIIQLQCQRDVLIAALADAQRRLGVLRHKTRPCGCGAGVSEDADDTGMTLTDKAAEYLG